MTSSNARPSVCQPAALYPPKFVLRAPARKGFRSITVITLPLTSPSPSPSPALARRQPPSFTARLPRLNIPPVKNVWVKDKAVSGDLICRGDGARRCNPWISTAEIRSSVIAASTITTGELSKLMGKTMADPRSSSHGEERRACVYGNLHRQSYRSWDLASEVGRVPICGSLRVQWSHRDLGTFARSSDEERWAPNLAEEIIPRARGRPASYSSSFIVCTGSATPDGSRLP